MRYEIGLKFEVLTGVAAVSPNWPATIPQSIQQRGFGIVPLPNVVRTKVEAGPTLQRPRYSVEIDEVTGIIIVTQTQLETFWAFYRTILGSGALRFNWKHPITGTAAVCQFNGEEPPIVKSV